MLHISFLSFVLMEFTDHLSKYQLVKKNYASWRLIIVPTIKLIFCVNCRADREAQMSKLQDYMQLLDKRNSASFTHYYEVCDVILC
jgi:hypothetical protein